MEIWPSAQSPFPKLKYGSSSPKTCRSRYQNVLVLSSFIRFPYFVPNILPRIVWANKHFVLTWSSLLQTLLFRCFLCYQSITPSFNENLKPVGCFKILNLTVFIYAVFRMFSLDQTLTVKSFQRHLLVVFWQN